MTLSARDVFDAIDALRNETRDARHAQANNTQRAIADMEQRLGTRISAVELMIAATNPTSLGPRINDLERWQSRSDADQSGGLPARIADLERWREQMGGVVKALGIVATLSGILSGVLAVVAFAK